MKVIQLAVRKLQLQAEADADNTDFTTIIEQNEKKQERLRRERRQANMRLLRCFRAK